MENKEDNKKLILNLNNIDELYAYKDMCICALRYAVDRHTYVVEEVCDYIKEHADIILDKRVVNVMIHTIDIQLDTYSDVMSEGAFYTNLCAPDDATLRDLKEFLINYDYAKFRETN